MVYESHGEEQTKAVAHELAQRLRPSDTVCLYGDLGVGKSVFVRGIAEYFDITEHVTSPTFTIVNEYYGRMPLYHFDVYRIADSEEMYEIGYDEYINGDGVCVIEWAQIISDILPDERYCVTIEKDYEKGEDYRRIEIKKESASRGARQ